MIQVPSYIVPHLYLYQQLPSYTIPQLYLYWYLTIQYHTYTYTSTQLYNIMFITTPALTPCQKHPHNSSSNIRMPVLNSSYTYASTYTTPITFTTAIYLCQYLYNISIYSNMNMYSNSTINSITYNSSRNNQGEIYSSSDINYLSRYMQHVRFLLPSTLSYQLA